MEIFRIITASLIIVITSYVIGLSGFYLKTRIYDTSLKTLKVPKLILFTSIGTTFSAAVAMFCGVMFYQLPECLFVVFIFPFLLIGVWLILYSINWRIEIDQESFVFNNSFGKKNEYKYDEIIKVKRLRNGGFKIFLENKVITVDCFIEGKDNLWDILKIIDFS